MYLIDHNPTVKVKRSSPVSVLDFPQIPHTTPTTLVSCVMSDLPIPGSVHLVAAGDGGEMIDASHTTANGSIILHPHPSHDINDPLNWSRNRKRLATFCLFVCE